MVLNIMNIILIFVISLCQYTIQSYIPFKISYYKGDYSYRLPISLGNYQTDERITININSQYSYLTCRVEDEFLFSLINLSSFECSPIYLEITNETFIGYQQNNPISLTKRNTIDISNDYLVNLSYYIIENTTISSTEVNSLGFAYSITNHKHSLIHQLKIKGLIDKLSFTFIRHDVLGGMLYFGLFPSDTISNLHHSYCDIIGKGHRWDCLLTQVKLNSETNETIFDLPKESTYAFFDTARSYIYAPKQFLDFLYNHYFRAAIINHDCFIYKSRGAGQIACEDFIIDKLGNITFTIGDYAYEYDMWQFWYCGDICYFEILLNQDGNYWILGSNFLHPYSITFDYEKKRIDFYSKGQVYRITKETKSTYGLKGYLIVSIIILFIGLCINSMTLIKMKGIEVKFLHF